MNLRHLFYLIVIVTAFGCTSAKKLAYFQGTIPPLNADSIYRITINPGDILSVNVATINSDAYPYLAAPNDKSAADTRSPYERGITVNSAGEIKLPLIGTVNLKGMTLEDATNAIESKFKEYINDPVVTVKKLNFKITLLGEVNRPGTYQIMNEKATLPEVLGMAGDLSQFADRKNLRIIREENGQRKDLYVDITRASSLTASTFYLHPDDIIYAPPVGRRAFQNISPSVTVFTSILTTTVVVLTFIITRQ
jgi:polysaccharide export outer membrane protein